MNIEDYLDGKMITLSKAFDDRAKILNVFYFFVFFAGGIISLNMVIENGEMRPIDGLVLLISAATFFAAYRFINKAMFSERLFVNKTQLQIIEAGVFSKKVKNFELIGISAFRHLAKPELSNHPLAGQSIDYLGFQTEQKVINEMHGDKRIGFRYDGRDVIFGENIYSWDFEELETILFEVTGKDFRSDDSFEKTFNPESENLEQDSI